MNYSVEFMVELVLYFHYPLSMDYDIWNQHKELKPFEEGGYAHEQNGNIELTDKGKVLLHSFIQTETDKVIEVIKKKGKETYLQDFISELKYGDNTEEFVKYLMSNAYYNNDSRIKEVSIVHKNRKELLYIVLN